MKALLTLLMLWFCIPAYANSNTYNKLCEVNKCWTEQKDIDRNIILPGGEGLNERQWIAVHLAMVEQVLRSRSTAHLSIAQKINRMQSLDDLHEYWLSGKFPINEDYSYRTPIFIDKHDNFCAVGYLVKASGHEDVSRMIASKTNLAYVRQMNYPELNAWASEYGFTADELAWIQPGYPVEAYAGAIGDGTDGTVYDLHADEPDGKLYIGGDFKYVDGNKVANNIAYIIQAATFAPSAPVYEWGTLGSGVKGKVNAIQKFDGKVFVGGSITEAGGNPVYNIAYWQNDTWHSAGCIYGEVKDLIVYKGELYASGRFDVCATLADVNFAKWDGTKWEHIPGTIGTINTMEVWNGDIVLGGDFDYGQSVNIIKWNPATNFQLFDNTIMGAVNDLEVYQNQLYAATDAAGDDTMYRVKILANDTWGDHPMNFNATASVRTLCTENDGLMAGGLFTNKDMMAMVPVENCISLTGFADWFLVDNAINKMAMFNGILISGGSFKYSSGFTPKVTLNSMAYKSSEPTSIDDIQKKLTVKVYPNPATNKIIIEGKGIEYSYSICNIQGQAVQQGTSSRDIDVSKLQAGNYFIKLQTATGSSTARFIKQ